MANLPKTLDDAIAQAKAATEAALNDGLTRIQVEMVFPEIALQAQPIARQFTSLFEHYGSGLKVLFPDTGAAALARRDWEDVPFKVDDIGTERSPVERRMEPEDELYLIVSPSSVEVKQVEKLCNLAEGRPCLLLNPRLEDLKIVGIGYAARQLRERFLSTIESCYYLQPLEGAALRRAYPGSWEIWQEIEGNYQLIAEEPIKPAGDALDLILAGQSSESEDETQEKPAPKKAGVFSSLQRFLKALSS
jgi:hypothetical protein